MTRSYPKDWTTKSIGEFATRVERRVSGVPEHILMIASRSGFVPQSDKYDRFMAGQSLQKYIELRSGEFAYNKGNSTTYPCGCVYRLKGYETAAVPFVYFCFVVNEQIAEPAYLEQFFSMGGLNPQLRGRINSGVRNNGLLNIRAEDFFSCEIPLPPLREQRRIGALLSSFDKAIEKARTVIDQQEVVRQALLQELLTRGLPGRHTQFKMTKIGEVPEEWAVLPLGELAEVGNGSTPSRARTDYWEDGIVPWLPTGKVNDRIITAADEFVTEKALSECPIKLLPRGTVLMAMIGQGKTRGMVAYLAIEACINQNFAYITSKGRILPWFLFGLLEHRYENIRASSQGSNQGALNCGIIKKYPVPLPPNDEQALIAGYYKGVDERLRAGRLAAEQLASVKAALMSVLLTGEVRVTPDEATA